ncbi:POLR protein, partial [Climacteris rufus]|nr:POLR protein [Climacteris rufus]
ILTARLSEACPINPRQQGFISTLGCSENLKLFQLLICHAIRENRDLAVIFVDIVKAFDTISHQHISTGLQQRQMDPQIMHLINNMYENIFTCFD